MNKSISNRVKEEAEYLIKTESTIREVAHHFKMSKSTVHKDLQERLKKISPENFFKVRQIVENNLLTRHIRGGEKTKQKYAKKVSE